MSNTIDSLYDDELRVQVRSNVEIPRPTPCRESHAPLTIKIFPLHDRKSQRLI